jgi:hypothetical protein
MHPSMKFLHPILSWLLVSALILEDIVLSEAKALSPCIRMYLGIQQASSKLVRLSWESHPLRLFVVSVNRRILSLLGHKWMCTAVSLQPQLGHFSSGHSKLEYFPTWTRVPQKPVCCLDLHSLYMSDFDFMARSRCSQSTLS